MSEQYFFRINGLSSGDSVDKLEAAIKAIQGVEFVEVDLESEMASIKGKMTAVDIKDVIAQSGYNAVMISN